MRIGIADVTPAQFAAGSPPPVATDLSVLNSMPLQASGLQTPCVVGGTDPVTGDTIASCAPTDTAGMFAVLEQQIQSLAPVNYQTVASPSVTASSLLPWGIGIAVGLVLLGMLRR